MARFSLSLLTIFLVLAALALSLPTQRDGQSSIDSALNAMKSATNMFEDFDNHENNQASAAAPMPQDNDSSNSAAPQPAEMAAKSDTDHPSPTDKKPFSGKFATPTSSPTPATTSVQPNALGNIPILGSIIGGGGGLL